MIIVNNQTQVDLVTSGASSHEQLDAEFSSPTGYEAYAKTERSTPYIRITYGVRVIIVPDHESANGYRGRYSVSNKLLMAAAMLNLKMGIYSQATGVQITIAWTNEEEYQLGKKFLTDMGASCGQSSDRRGEKPAFFYLENRQQLEALFKFRKSLREKQV